MLRTQKRTSDSLTAQRESRFLNSPLLWLKAMPLLSVHIYRPDTVAQPTFKDIPHLVYSPLARFVSLIY